MCTVSMVGDHYNERWQQYTPDLSRAPLHIITPPSRAEFDALKREVEEMKELLHAAKRIDTVTGQPDCEMESKLAVLRAVADLVGVDIEFPRQDEEVNT